MMDIVTCMECYALVQSRYTTEHRAYHKTAMAGLLLAGEPELSKGGRPSDDLIFIADQLSCAIDFTPVNV